MTKALSKRIRCSTRGAHGRISFPRLCGRLRGRLFRPRLAICRADRCVDRWPSAIIAWIGRSRIVRRCCSCPVLAKRRTFPARRAGPRPSGSSPSISPAPAVHRSRTPSASNPTRTTPPACLTTSGCAPPRSWAARWAPRRPPPGRPVARTSLKGSCCSARFTSPTTPRGRWHVNGPPSCAARAPRLEAAVEAALQTTELLLDFL
jgi:hypothetical protein